MRSLAQRQWAGGREPQGEVVSRMIEPTKATLRAQRDALIAANGRAQARIAELERGWLRRWWRRWLA